MIRMYRYVEDGKSFILVDGRDVDVPRLRSPRSVHDLCLVHGVDGIGVLDRSDRADFRAGFLDADGRPLQGRILDGAVMCSVAFADLVGVKPFHSTEYTVEEGGRLLPARILSHLGECKVVELSGTRHAFCGIPADNSGPLTGDTLCQGEVE